jgi:hypothetical protein
MNLRTIVFTSDDYLHCLPGFAYLHNKHIGESQEAVVVCFKKGRSKLPDNFTKHSLGKQQDFTWSSAAIEFLSSIDDPLVLLMLEDYFLQHADMGKIKALRDYMLAYPGIGKIDLTNDRLKVAHKPHGTWRGGMKIIRSAHNASYTFSLQAALWRREFLLKYLDAEEDPWQMEKGASRRFADEAGRGRDKSIILGCEVPPMEYVNAIGGEGNKPRVWDRVKFPLDLWTELAELGYVEDEE